MRFTYTEFLINMEKYQLYCTCKTIFKTLTIFPPLFSHPFISSLISLQINLDVNYVGSQCEINMKNFKHVNLEDKNHGSLHLMQLQINLMLSFLVGLSIRESLRGIRQKILFPRIGSFGWWECSGFENEVNSN